MPMSSHGSLHQFATLRLKTYILARKGRELLVACRPPRGLTPPGMVMVPCPAPCGSGWGGCGWVAMLVDGVVVFVNGVESYGICKELDLVRERRQTWKAHSLMMGQ